MWKGIKFYVQNVIIIQHRNVSYLAFIIIITIAAALEMCYILNSLYKVLVCCICICI